jgi:hypothetical protein
MDDPDRSSCPIASFRRRCYNAVVERSITNPVVFSAAPARLEVEMIDPGFGGPVRAAAEVFSVSSMDLA